MPTTITQLPSAVAPDSNYVLPSDNAGGSATQKLTVQQINDLSRTYDIANLGEVGGSVSINFGPDRLIQVLSLNGTSTTFSKGTGWPAVTNKAADVVLNITVTAPTTIVWSIVTNWLVIPPAGALSAGNHTFLLRAIGISTVQGLYIGDQT